MIKEVAPEGFAVSIEPHPLNFKFLYLNCIINDIIRQVKLYNVAAYDEDNKLLRLYESYHSGSHSLVLKRDIRRVILVRTRTIDSIVAELALNKVDLLKIDVEGAEAKVLRGAMSTLYKFRPITIVEVFRFNLRNALTILTELKYRVRVVKESLTVGSAGPAVYIIAEPRD